MYNNNINEDIKHFDITHLDPFKMNLNGFDAYINETKKYIEYVNGINPKIKFEKINATVKWSGLFIITSKT